MWWAVGVTFERDGGHRDGWGIGKSVLEVVLLRLDEADVEMARRDLLDNSERNHLRLRHGRGGFEHLTRSALEARSNGPS